MSLIRKAIKGTKGPRILDSRLRAELRKPDLKQVASLALWALALNFAWEMLQAPLFVGMLEMPAWDATKRCLQATFGDAMMILIAFAAVGLARRDWGWIQRPSSSALSAFWLLAAWQALASVVSEK